MPTTPDPWQVKLLLDVPEPRAGRARIVAAADGTTWDADQSVNIFIDPVTRTAFPMPYPRRADWASGTGSGFQRVRKADYSGLTATSWSDLPRRADNDWYLQSAGGVSETATTTASYPANQAWHLSAYVSGVQSASEQVFLECGWGVPGAAGSITLRFRHGGSVTVIKGTEPVGRYDWNGGSVSGAVRQTATPEQQRTVNFLFLPCRWRSLLCVVDGGGFEHVFGDLDALAAVQPVITPDGSFWWKVPVDAGSACVQLAPVQFAPSATLYSRLIRLRQPPPAGSMGSLVTRVFSDVAGQAAVSPLGAITLVDAFSLATFAPDGVLDNVRVKLVLTRDSGTPYGALGVCAADITLPPTGTTTYNLPKDVTNRFEIVLDVPEGGPATIHVHTTMPKKVEQTDGVAQILVTTDRPVGMKIGALDVFRGTLDYPRQNWAIPGLWPLSVSFVGSDRDIEPGFSYYFDARPFDNEPMIDAARQIWQDIGVPPSDLFITADGFKLPYSPRASLGEWLLCQEAGQTRGEWLERFRRDYAATWITGWRPTATGYKWFFASPETAPLSTSQMTLYEGKADATAAGVSANLLPERVIRGSSSSNEGPVYERIPAAANHVAVIGYDPRRRSYPYAFVSYAASQNAGTAPADRPVGWRGRIHAAIRPDSRVQSTATAERIRNILDVRAARPRERVTWASRLLIRESDNVPIWRGDLVTIMQTSATVRGIFRVTSLKARLMKNVLGERPIWVTEYTAERILGAA